MERFAKLYEFEDIGQVLVKLDTGDDGVDVRFFFKPEELGACSLAMTFKRSERGDEWDKAERAFNLVDENKAYALVSETLKTIPASLAEE